MQYPGQGVLPRDQNSIPAAGAASLTDINASAVNAHVLPLVIDDATNRLLVTAVVTSNALPTGAATSANQTTEINSLASIDGKLPVLGQALAAASIPVVLTAAQLATLTPLSSVTVTQGTGTNLHTVIDSGTVTTVSTLTNITNWGNIVDNAAFVDGTTRLMPAAYIFDEVAGTALTENDAAAARIDAKRAQVFTLEDTTTRGTRLNIVTRDLAAGAADTGIMAFGVRRTADTSPVSTDADVHPMVFDDLGNLKVNIKAGGAGDGTILDGVNNTIKVTVFDYANSNPLGVVLRDTNGDYVSVGGGTQYTEDAVSVADPVGTVLNLIRNDARTGAITTTDGDNIAARGTNSGELYVKHVDALPIIGNVAHDAVGTGQNPALVGGYASAAAPTDVSADGDSVRAWYLRNGAQATVLTAAGALVGGDAANGLDVDVTRLPALVAGTALIGKVGIDQTTAGTTNAVSLAQIGATTVLGGNGASGAGALRVTIANDSTGILATVGTVTTVSTLTSITNWGNIVDNAGFTDGTTRLSMGGFIYDEVAGTALTENDAAAARINVNRAQVQVIEDGATRGRYQTITTRGSSLIEGPTASDAVLAAAPVTVGGRASYAEPTAMSADGDVVDIWVDRRGRNVVKQQAGTGTQTTVAGSATNVTLLAANTSRLGAIIVNDSAAILYVRYAATATTSNYTVKMMPDAYHEVPFGYTGIIDGIWSSATGNARVTELT